MMYDREICVINESIYNHRKMISSLDLFEAKYDSIYFMAMQ